MEELLGARPTVDGAVSAWSQQRQDITAGGGAGVGEERQLL